MQSFHLIHILERLYIVSWISLQTVFSKHAWLPSYSATNSILSYFISFFFNFYSIWCVFRKIFKCVTSSIIFSCYILSYALIIFQIPSSLMSKLYHEDLPNCVGIFHVIYHLKKWDHVIVAFYEMEINRLIEGSLSKAKFSSMDDCYSLKRYYLGPLGEPPPFSRGIITISLHLVGLLVEVG